LRNIIKNIGLADLDYELIEENDRIAVGISGGKDSSLLLYTLELYRQKSRKNFTIIGIHINLGFGEEPFDELESFFSQHNLKLERYDSMISVYLDLNKKKDIVQCSLCSKLKKGAVIDKAKELNCNKVAFAHHADDAIETLFLNAIYGGKLSTFDPKMYMSEAQVTFIRPFVYVTEEEIINECKILGIPRIKSNCPVDGLTKRQFVKEQLNALYKEVPLAQKNFIKMLSNQKQLKLWKKSVDKSF
jgi:tRNA 2-thiocytidine biosynthesis protein TtcA